MPIQNRLNMRKWLNWQRNIKELTKNTKFKKQYDDQGLNSKNVFRQTNALSPNLFRRRRQLATNVEGPIINVIACSFVWYVINVAIISSSLRCVTHKDQLEGSHTSRVVQEHRESSSGVEDVTREVVRKTHHHQLPQWWTKQATQAVFSNLASINKSYLLFIIWGFFVASLSSKQVNT